MQILLNIVKRFTVIACISLIILGCSRISQSNFDKIKPEMSMQEVVAILGEPTTSDSVNIAGISGTSATWKDKQIEISIQFLNNQVAAKSLNKISPDESRSN